jgi:hypothetical protein
MIKGIFWLALIATLVCMTFANPVLGLIVTFGAIALNWGNLAK